MRGGASSIHPRTSTCPLVALETAAWPLVVTDLCCCRTTDPDVASGSSTGQNLTMVPCGIASYSQQGVPHYPQVSSSTSLCCIHSLWFLYLLLLVAPGVSECLGSSQVGVSCIIVPDRVHLEHGAPGLHSAQLVSISSQLPIWAP